MTGHNLCTEQPYNTDETGLFWKCITYKTLAGAAETDQDIIDHVTGSSVTPPPWEVEEKDETEDAQTEVKVHTNTKAIEHLKNAIFWHEAEDEPDQMHLRVLRFPRENAVRDTAH